MDAKIRTCTLLLQLYVCHSMLVISMLVVLPGASCKSTVELTLLDFEGYTSVLVSTIICVCVFASFTASCNVVKISIQILKSYDFTILRFYTYQPCRIPLKLQVLKDCVKF